MSGPPATIVIPVRDVGTPQQKPVRRVLWRVEPADFTLQLLPAPVGYKVLVESPAGQGQGWFEIPSHLHWSGPREEVSEEVGAAAAAGFPSSSPSEIGELLFRRLFRDQVGSLFLSSLRLSPERGLRIRLRLSPEMGEILALPWELLHLPDTFGVAGLTRRISIVISIDLPQPAHPPIVARRVRVLAVTGWSRKNLDLESECRHLKEASGWRSRLAVSFLHRPDRLRLRREVVACGKSLHVLHFMGHGRYDAVHGAGSLLFQDGEGRPQAVSAEGLAVELEGCSSLQLVVLNACETGRGGERRGEDPFAGMALALVRAGIPAVIAMRSRVPDWSAVAFTRVFYRRLSAGDPVEVALAEARIELHREGGDGDTWSVPVLFLRGATGNLFRRPPVLRRWLWGLSFLLLASLAWFFVGQELRKAEAVRLNNHGFALLKENTEVAGTEARRALLDALRLDPGSAPAHSNLASLEEREGRLSLALGQAEAAVEAAPAEAVYLYNVGRLLIRLEETTRAIDPLLQALALQPCHSRALNELGSAYLSLERYKEARRAFEVGLRCDSKLPPLYKNLGRVALAEGRAEEAVRHFQQAIRSYALEGRPDLEEPTYWLAAAYAQQGDRDRACQTLAQYQRLTAGHGARAVEAARLFQQKECEGVY